LFLLKEINRRLTFIQFSKDNHFSRSFGDFYNYTTNHSVSQLFSSDFFVFVGLRVSDSEELYLTIYHQ
ncbi:hypothetical protein, partial [Bacillus piscicola]|uniref:hypothetical protein n=1 Tax=Bacillus piscicola TaxID=1632684 RepID=UPI001F096A69